MRVSFSPRLIAAVGLCVLACAAPVRAADTFEELKRASVFSFAVISDHHGYSPYSLMGREGKMMRLDRMDQWVKENGDSFVVGVGDHTYTYLRNDPFIPFMNDDPFWNTRFYPAIGNHDNHCYCDSESTRCGGSPLFNEVDIHSRPWVTFRGDCEYYARIPVGDWTVHLVHVQYAYRSADPLVAFTQDSRDYLVNTLSSIVRGPRDIVIATAHMGSQGDGNWVSVLSPAEQDVVMRKCDLVLAGDTHRYQRYIHPAFGETGGALCLNDGSLTGSYPNSCYLECFVLDSPPRLVTVRQRVDDCSSLQLRTDSFNGAYSSYVKLTGQVDGSVDWIDSADKWDICPAGASSPAGVFNSGWNLVSVPLEPVDMSPEAVFGGLVSAGNTLPNKLDRYDPAEGYQVYPSQYSSVQSGRGYWLYLENPGTIRYSGSSMPDACFLTLGQGWNLIGLPRTWPVSLGSVQVRAGGGSPVTWYNAVQLGWVDASLYYYDGSSYGTVRTSGGDDTYLRPWKGYWLNAKRGDLTLRIPPGAEPTPVVKISDVQAGEITATTAAVTWSSLVFATQCVDYGLSSSYGESTGTDTDPAHWSRSHSMTLTALAPGTTYHYRVTSTSDGCAPGVSSDVTFTTAPSATLPADAGFESGGLNDWVLWPSGQTLVQVAAKTGVGGITPHSGGRLAYSKWAQVDQNGGMYARVATTVGRTYEASVWSNMHIASSPPVPTGDCKARVGIDPRGGRDPREASVVWSAWDERPNLQPTQWRKLSVQAQAQSGIVTIFLEFYQRQQPQYYQMVNAFDDAAVTAVGP